MNGAPNMKREVAARLQFTLAEATVLAEHLDEVGTGSESLRAAIANNNGAKVIEVWTGIVEHIAYVSGVLEWKGTAAARQYVESEEDN